MWVVTPTTPPAGRPMAVAIAMAWVKVAGTVGVEPDEEMEMLSK